MTGIKVKQMELPGQALGWVRREGMQRLLCCSGHERLGGFKCMEPAVALLGQHPVQGRELTAVLSDPAVYQMPTM